MHVLNDIYTLTLLASLTVNSVGKDVTKLLPPLYKRGMSNISVLPKYLVMQPSVDKVVCKFNHGVLYS